MKKVLVIVLSVILILGLAAGGLLYYYTTTPEYALKKMAEDVETSGIEGLKSHLSQNMLEKVEKVQYWTDNPTITGILALFTEKDIADFFMAEIAKIDWKVDEVMRGKTRTDVVLHFDYYGSLSGTIEVIMVKEDGEWKIDGAKFPHFENISLFENIQEGQDIADIVPVA